MDFPYQPFFNYVMITYRIPPDSISFVLISKQSNSHTHTHTLTHTHIQWHSHINTHTDTHTHTHAHAHTHTHARTHTHMRAHTRTHPHARTHALTRARAHTHARTRARTHTRWNATRFKDANLITIELIHFLKFISFPLFYGGKIRIWYQHAICIPSVCIPLKVLNLCPFFTKLGMKDKSLNLP